MRRVVRPGIVAVVFNLLTVTSVGALANAQSSEDSPAGFSADLAGVGPEAPDYRSTLQASDPRISGTWTFPVGWLPVAEPPAS